MTQEKGMHFRTTEASELLHHLELHHSIELVGMKRVGINNFLRNFLASQAQNRRFLLVLIDMNSLLERELFSFWILTFKRILDAVREGSFPKTLEAKITHDFEHAIQTKDLFYTFENIRSALREIVKTGRTPVLIFNRFDRIQDAARPELYDNMYALKSACDQKLSFVFTSFRQLDELMPQVFADKAHTNFAATLPIKPATDADLSFIVDELEVHYQLQLPEEIKNHIIHLSGGHIQYLRLLFLFAHENISKIKNAHDFEKKSLLDERIILQSDELWESLNDMEKAIVKKIVKGEKITKDQSKDASYIWETGLINEKNKIFSPVFADFVETQIKNDDAENGRDLTKKELALLNLLKKKPGEIIEREVIIETVWPEYEDWGASDWSVDKLVARLRAKLKASNSPYQVITIKTRGYKLTT